jgi:hypothetical protein
MSLIRTMKYLLPICFFGGSAVLADPTGTISVNSNVDGANVYVDYVEVGVTPFEGDLTIGSHSIRIAADNFTPWTTRVEIEVGSSSEVSAELFSGNGTVEFMVTPVGAAVTVDGQVVGSAPIRLSDMPFGDHEFTLTAPQYEPVAGSFSYTSGANVLVFEQMQSSRGLFAFGSNPSGADVYLDSDFVGVTPLSLTEVDSGVHRVRVQLEGYGTVLREVDTSEGSRGDVQVTMVADSPELIVKTGNDDATVYVDGHLIEEGSKVSLDLARGTYVLRVEAPGFQTAERSVRVPREGRVSYRATLSLDGSPEHSALEIITPLTSRWTFWAAVGAGAVGAGVTGAIVAESMEPDPPPTGDVEVLLP